MIDEKILLEYLQNKIKDFNILKQRALDRDLPISASLYRRQSETCGIIINYVKELAEQEKKRYK